jgi:hypothetical protein
LRLFQRITTRQANELAECGPEWGAYFSDGNGLICMPEAIVCKIKTGNFYEK